MKKRDKITKPVRFTVLSECGGCGQDIEIVIDSTDVDYTPEDPGCYTMRNGDPGWPSSPAECDYVGDGAFHCPCCDSKIELEPETIEDAFLQMLHDGGDE